MKRLLTRGELTEDHIDRVVRTLVRFYRSQVPTPEIAVWGQVDRIRCNTDENFAQTEQFIGDTIERPVFLAIRYYTDRFYTLAADRFAARVREGWIRDCHGDLHLGHIHITPRRVCIYDCIEFNDRFRYIDVANDVAFLAMDLDYHGRPDLARHFLDRMAVALGDPNMHTVLNFYRCYRAYVRGKVESMRAADPQVFPSARASARNRARKYFQLALRYAVAGADPLVVVVMGPIATGKSTVAAYLGHALGWPVYASDVLRKELAGLPLYMRPRPENRAWLYASEMKQRVYAALIDRARAAIRTHRGVILDATFGRHEYRERLRNAFQDTGVPCVFIETTASPDVIRHRLRLRARADRVVSDAREEDMTYLLRAYEPPDELPEHLHVRVSTEMAPEEVRTVVLREMVERHLHREVK